MLLAGPFAGRLLGDMGAEIIKVEPPGQPDPLREWGKARYEGRSLWWPVQSRNKKCVTLEPARRGRAGAAAPARGALRRRWSRTSARGRSRSGTSAPSSSGEVNPRLVIARVSGYGQTGPYAKRAGFASVAEAMGGIRYINGFPGEAPPRIHISLGDSLAGMFAVQGILAALYRRDALGGGRGQVVDVSLMEACFALLESTVPEYDRLGIVRGPGGTGLEGRRAVEHLQVERRQVDGDRRQRGQRLPAALRGDGPARARRRPEVRDPPRARREPGGARGDRRRLGGAARPPPRSTGCSTTPA